jgi:hypothetical protein
MEHLIGKVVFFKEKIEDMECYPEVGMKAVIVGIDESGYRGGDVSEHIYTITFDYSEFDDYNKRFESSNYFGKDGLANLNAREANQYDTKEHIYFGSPIIDPFEKYFELLDENQLKLAANFKASGETDYIKWLEDKVMNIK